jgi:hypothetical protein
MRRYLPFFCLSLACSTLAWWAPPAPPRGAEEHLQHKAQRLVEQCVGAGHGHATVTLVEGDGCRRTEATGLGNGVVYARQHRGETAGKGAEKLYTTETTSEKMEVPRHTVMQRSDRWVERIGVGVVVDGPAPARMRELLVSGLGLEEGRDSVTVVVK